MEIVALHCNDSVLSRDAVMEARQSRLASPHPTLDLPLNHSECSLPTLDLNIAAAPYQVPLAVVLLWIFGYCHLARYPRQRLLVSFNCCRFNIQNLALNSVYEDTLQVTSLWKLVSSREMHIRGQDVMDWTLCDNRGLRKCTGHIHYLKLFVLMRHHLFHVLGNIFGMNPLLEIETCGKYFQLPTPPVKSIEEGEHARPLVHQPLYRQNMGQGAAPPPQFKS